MILWLLVIPLRVLGGVAFYAGLFVGLLWLDWARQRGMFR